VNLCSHLGTLCKAERPSLDLAERLERVRQSAERIWQRQRLEWFPDHTVAHSDRIIGHLGNILCGLQDTNQRLNVHELFILLASSYLHDIGMQDFRIDERTVDQLTISDYEVIRNRHAERSSELILHLRMELDRQAFRIDLDDEPQYFVPIALVSKAHGSSFFDDTVNELGSSPYWPGNQDFRGELVAALLLMADELDLHEVRASFPPGLDVSPLATLHNHIHHYITEVKVMEGGLPTQRRVRIIFEYPSDSETYQTDIRWWVVSKVCKQMRRTQSIIQKATAGQLGWDRPVHIQEFKDKYGARRQLPRSAQLRLQCERAEAEIVDRVELVKTIKHALCASQPQGELVEIADRDNSDWSQLLKWLTSAIRLHDAELLHISFEFTVAHSPLDILERCYKRLASLGLSCSAYQTAKVPRTGSGENRLDLLSQALISDLEKQGAVPRVIMLFERIDKADPQTSQWVKESLLSKLQGRHGPLLTIVTYRDSGKDLGLGRCFRLEAFSQDTVANHLTKRLGFRGREARDKAQEVYTLSRGTPLYVLNYLHLEEEQQFSLQ
jgi:hypothetical protein